MTVQVEDLDWWTVSEDSTVGAVRRAATVLATNLGLPEPRVAQLGIVATEIASNLYKHAVDGVVHLRALRDDEHHRAGVELVAIDSGPGMADLTRSIRDGHSTAGTLGIGLGAIGRQAGELDIYSEPGRGTVLTAIVWSGTPPTLRRWAAGLVRPIAGETVSGDAYAVREADGRIQAMVADGLGHGPLAALASQSAVTAFRQAPATAPAAVLDHIHRTVSHTRGAVAAVIELDQAAGMVRWASVGNISGWLVKHQTRRGLAAQPGFIGDRQRRTIRDYEYPLDADDVVVLHTDGLTDRWNVTDHPGLLVHPPLTIAATLLREAGLRRDDAGVLVARLADSP